MHRKALTLINSDNQSNNNNNEQLIAYLQRLQSAKDFELILEFSVNPLKSSPQEAIKVRYIVSYFNTNTCNYRYL